MLNRSFKQITLDDLDVPKKLKEQGVDDPNMVCYSVIRAFISTLYISLDRVNVLMCISLQYFSKKATHPTKLINSQ